MRRKRGAVFLDRDGTILNERGYLSDPKKMKIYSFSYPALRALAKAKIPLVIISNQSGIGRGYFTRAHTNRVHKALKKAFAKKGVRFAGIYFCPHHPTAGCACRKPKPLLVRRAAKSLKLDLKHSYVVGDQKRDVQLARNIGAKGILVRTGAGTSAAGSSKRVANKITSNLLTASKWILNDIMID